MYKAIVFSIFIKLRNHPHNLILQHLSHPEENLCPVACPIPPHPLINSSSLQICLFGILHINGIIQYVFLVTFLSLNKVLLYYLLSMRINGECQLYKLNPQSHIILRSILLESGVVSSFSFLYLLGRLLLFSQLSKVVRHLERINPHKIEKETSYTCGNPHFKQWYLHKPFCFCGEFGTEKLSVLFPSLSKYLCMCLSFFIKITLHSLGPLVPFQ